MTDYLAYDAERAEDFEAMRDRPRVRKGRRTPANLGRAAVTGHLQG